MTTERTGLHEKVIHAASLLARDENAIANCEELLAHLGSALQWDWVALWKLNVNVLQVSAAWVSPAVHASELEAFTRRWFPESGEGMVGQAWRQKRSLLSVNLVRDMVLPRSLLTTTPGFVTGMWIPIIKFGAVYGVLEFLGTNTASTAHEQISHIETLAAEIAPYVPKF